jgi:hypothetical protein
MLVQCPAILVKHMAAWILYNFLIPAASMMASLVASQSVYRQFFMAAYIDDIRYKRAPAAPFYIHSVIQIFCILPLPEIWLSIFGVPV